MRISRTFLSLPPSLLLLLVTQLHAQADSRTDKDGSTLPTAVRKMSLDEGEKFMPEYYAFAPVSFAGGGSQILARQAAALVLTPEENALLASNSSAALAFRPPFALHNDYKESDSDPWSVYRRGREVIARLRDRSFTCPNGTHDCASISQPNYCCTDGTVCFVVENAPDAGNVGCCPDGQTCGGSVAACADGNTACPAADGGGCCIPGFVCADIGCVVSTSATPTPTTTAAQVTSSKPTTATPTPSQTTTSSTSSSSSSSSFISTSSSSPSPSSTSTGTGLPPVRATSSSPYTTTSKASTESTSTGTAEYCPTGFYACLATAGLGCCRTGRDCSTTSCPPAAKTTIITHGATIVVPLTDAQAAATPTATCASGWFQCGADAGPVAGCCPSGYACGTASCTLAAATATETVQKELPGNVAGRSWRGVLEQQTVLVCIVLGWTMFWV
ncbi:hypothetical protein F4861DRAFT_537402 [Xylaria intraflava]|nr:hypothetical protein F4861DRAFT_537402 [Xylaria intraflava]